MESRAYEIFDTRDSVKTKSMWSGSLTKIFMPNLRGMSDENRIISIVNPMTPALLSIINEIVVNSSDHCWNCLQAVKRKELKPSLAVKNISVLFDDETGEITVYNDGKGLPVEVHEAASKKAKRDVYIPEIAFGWYFAGSNMTKKDEDIRSGVNGLGAKLCNTHSKYFIVETVDYNTKLKYVQKFREGLKYIDEPEIEKIKIRGDDAEASHTAITFLPDYASLDTTKEMFPNIKMWLKLRCNQLSAFLNMTSKVSFQFNNEETVAASTDDLARMMQNDGDAILSTQVKSSDETLKPFPWQISIIISNEKRNGSMSIINGTNTDSGSHLTYIKKMINSVVNVKIEKLTGAEKKLTSTEIMSNISFVVCCYLKGAVWDSQGKTCLTVATSVLSSYSLPTKFLKDAAALITEIVLTKKPARKQKVKVEKYTSAKHLGKTAILMAGEGDSALSFLRKGLTQSESAIDPSFEWCGIMSLQGVFLNALKQIKTIEIKDGDSFVIRSDKLQKNKTLSAIVEILGLDYKCKYDKLADIDRLRYGKLIGCVDQDLDGTGKIMSLLLVFINCFWPNLIKNGFVGRFLTPVIRVYELKGKKAMVEEFYYESDYAKWSELHSNEKYDVRYYKGLAAHDDDEVETMFKHAKFKSSIYTYTLADTDEALFNIYFGDDPSLRKTVLSKPVIYLTDVELAEIERCRKIPCKVHLEIDTKAYKLDAIKRQLPHIIDGLNPSRRKVIYGAMKRWVNDSKPCKVFQFGGYIADKCFYHHGDASLNQTIIHMAQKFPNAKQYPLIIGIGRFGSRNKRDDSGKPRYVSVKISPMMHAMFPKEDMHLLPYTFVDGERAEPDYFIPVLPLSVMESISIPSEGWKHVSFSRDLTVVVKTVRRLMDGVGDKISESDDLIIIDDTVAASDVKPITASDVKPITASDVKPITASDVKPITASDLDLSLSSELKHGISLRENIGEVREINGKQYSYGKYEYDDEEETIYITELPISVCTETFLDRLEDNKYIADIDNYSKDATIAITIHLNKGAYAEITQVYGDSETDAIEDFLKLRQSLKPCLNYFGENGAVISCDDDYLTPIKHWFEKRKELYALRLQRDIELIKLRIIEQENEIRYVKCGFDIKSYRSLDDLSEMLKREKFVRIDSGLLHRPEFTPVDKLYQTIIEGPRSSYDYLINIKDREKIITELRKKEISLEDQRQELNELIEQLSEKPFIGYKQWNADIDHLLSVIDRGVRTSWSFKD
jgi:DNA topoisomerase-2